MVGCFGLIEGQQLPRFPSDRLAENRPRLEIWELLRCGALVDGATTELRWGEKACRLATHSPNLWIDGNPILVVWDEPIPGVGRPWFACPRCHRRCGHIFLDELACRKCLHLDYASRHLYRQTPAVHRVTRLRRKLGADPRPFAPLPERRRGRSRAYHERLVARIQAEEQALAEHLQTITGDLERRIQVRKARGEW